MKKLFIVSIVFSSISWAASISAEEITNMISAIKKEREGISLAQLENTKNPFIIVKKAEVIAKIAEKEAKKLPQEVIYTLHAILNHAAFINKKWYKKGSKLGSYRVMYIGKKSVNLRSESGNKILSIKKKKKKNINLSQGSK